MRRFYNKIQIEKMVEGRIGEYQQKFGLIPEPPVPIDDIIEHIFDLKISWETIQCQPGERIFGALRPQTRQIVINESEVALFTEKPGLERSTKGHELGHWDLFTDHASLGHPSFLNFDSKEHFVKRSTPNGEVEIIKLMMFDSELYSLFKQSQQGKDTPLVKTSVDYYASIMSMPRFLLIPYVKDIHDDWDSWSKKPFNYQLKDLYSLADMFEVTITALQVRLEQLNLLFIPKEEKTIYRNRDEYNGQLSLL